MSKIEKENRKAAIVVGLISLSIFLLFAFGEITGKNAHALAPLRQCVCK